MAVRYLSSIMSHSARTLHSFLCSSSILSTIDRVCHPVGNGGVSIKCFHIEEFFFFREKHSILQRNAKGWHDSAAGNLSCLFMRNSKAIFGWLGWFAGSAVTLGSSCSQQFIRAWGVWKCKSLSHAFNFFPLLLPGFTGAVLASI